MLAIWAPELAKEEGGCLDGLQESWNFKDLFLC